MSVINLHVSCSSTSIRSERRFDKGTTIATLKGKLEMLVGAAAAQMRLELYDREEKKVCDLDDDEAMLGRYPVEDYFRIHVVDLNPSATVGQFEDVSKVEKFELTDEEYSKRTDTVMAFKKRNKLGRFDPERAAAMAKKEEEQEHEGEEDAKAINKGDRCEVTIPGTGGPRRGMVMYKGKPGFKPGWWIGIKYDEPVGKNDGSVNGQRYFECPPKYGAFVRPANVTVGDFPEEDIDFSDDEM